MTEREQLEQSIAALEAQRALLGDAVVDPALAALREKLAALSPLPPAEQRKLLTILFADLSGFTAMSEHLDPEEVHTTMNALWARLDAAIRQEGGTIDKHIGDAVMALFGTPLAQEDDPERAIRAALAMQAALRAFPGDLRMRIGINTGPVLLAGIGTTGEHTALGDTVNTASRLEHAAPPGGILIAYATYRHVRGLFDVQVQPPLAVKGKDEPLQTYLVERARPRAFQVPTRGIEGIETPMIGRDQELRQLQAAFAACQAESRPRIVSVVAEAGVGKSRLLAAFQTWLAALPAPARVFQGRTDLRMMDRPYSLLRDLFAGYGAILDSDSLAVAHAKLEQCIGAVLGAAGPEPAHFIGHLLGLDYSDSPYLAGILDDPRQIQARAFGHLVAFFGAVIRQGPVALLLEDLHWADDGSLDLVAHLGRTLPDRPLLLVGMTRPTLWDRRPAWGMEPVPGLRIDLQPLTDGESRALVGAILRRLPAVPPALQDLVVGGAAGNPFYLEELVKMLIDDGVIETTGDDWAVTTEHLAALRVPATLTGVLQARLDRLPAAERAVLERAAVIGPVFWEAAVAHRAAGVGEDSGPALAEALAGLQAEALIQRRAESAFAGTGEWQFKHILLHEVVYERVLKRRRREYHRMVAAWLTEQADTRSEEYAALIGGHLERAGDRQAAAGWYVRAGHQARAGFVPAAAIDYYRRALDLGVAAAEQEAVYEGLGLALNQQARYDEAVAAYQAMRAAAADGAALARAWLGLARVQDQHGDNRLALESADQAEAAARVAGAAPELVRALGRKGSIYHRLGQVEQALALTEQALTRAMHLDTYPELFFYLNLLGQIHATLGHTRQAEQYYGQALARCQELGDQRAMGALLNNLGEVARGQGDYQAALDRYREALDLARATGNRNGEILVLSNLGGMLVGLGDYAAAEAPLRQSIEQAEAAGGAIFLAEAYSFLAESLLGQGHAAAAQAAAGQAQALAARTENPELIGRAWRALGTVAAGLGAPLAVAGGPYDAAACFAESLRAYTAAGMAGEQARTLRAWAQHETARGDPAKGAALWEQARALFTALDMPAELARMG